MMRFSILFFAAALVLFAAPAFAVDAPGAAKPAVPVAPAAPIRRQVPAANIAKAKATRDAVNAQGKKAALASDAKFKERMQKHSDKDKQDLEKSRKLYKQEQGKALQRQKMIAASKPRSAAASKAAAKAATAQPSAQQPVQPHAAAPVANAVVPAGTAK